MGWIIAPYAEEYTHDTSAMKMVRAAIKQWHKRTNQSDAYPDASLELQLFVDTSDFTVFKVPALPARFASSFLFIFMLIIFSKSQTGHAIEGTNHEYVSQI